MRENVVSYKYNYSANKATGLYVNKSKLMYLSVAFVIFIGLGYTFISDGAWFLLIMSCFIWVILSLIIMWSSGQKRLYITPRYLLCGDDIVYHHNVTAIEMSEVQGKMVIHTPNTILTISRDDFPTNARKDYKITKNKEEKFRKVSQKIINRVKAINPDFEVNAPIQQPTQTNQTRVRDLSRY